MGNTRSSSFDSGTLKADKIRASFANTAHNDSSSNHHRRILGNSSPYSKGKRFPSADSLTPEEYGWFEDFESPSLHHAISSEFNIKPLHRALTLPAPVSEPPMYILESSLETQQLWYTTAGRRPPQPLQEREYFEKLWSQNFETSSIKYEDLNKTNHHNITKTTPPIKTTINSSATATNKHRYERQGDVLFRGKSPFSNSVSRSFSDQYIPPSMTLQVPYFRIIRNELGNIYAEFLIVVSFGSQGAVTFGIWKRHSDFQELAKLIMDLNLKSLSAQYFKNSLLSWQCVLQRKRWFKSLDTEYLALKCFLIERFMHDILFEALAPTIISDFLGLD